MEVPDLIVDLAIMLSTAAVITIIIKKLRIPSILGYIVAGFLMGSNFLHYFNVHSISSIETWSEIGVVIILFHIGLEFDFHKLADIGSTAIISAAVKMAGVMCVGYAFGRLLGMSTMDCVREDGHAVLSVRDNGLGIAREKQGRVFERFYRVDKSRSRSSGGTGLGLAIVKHIAEIHNADIELDSTPGIGTEISVHFPEISKE